MSWEGLSNQIYSPSSSVSHMSSLQAEHFSFRYNGPEKWGSSLNLECDMGGLCYDVTD